MASCFNINNPADLILRGCLILELSGSRFWFDGMKFSWGEFDFDSTRVKWFDNPDCLMDALLCSNKACILFQNNSEEDLKLMILEKYVSYIR